MEGLALRPLERIVRRFASRVVGEVGEVVKVIVAAVRALGRFIREFVVLEEIVRRFASRVVGEVGEAVEVVVVAVRALGRRIVLLEVVSGRGASGVAGEVGETVEVVVLAVRALRRRGPGGDRKRRPAQLPGGERVGRYGGHRGCVIARGDRRVGSALEGEGKDERGRDKPDQES